MNKALAFCIVLGVLAASQAATAQQLDMSAYAGKVVYLDFWASWCIPCRQSFPWMADLQARFADRGLVVLAVNVDKDRQLAQKFLAAHPSDFPIVYDPNGSIASAYAVKAMPTSIVIGRDGSVQAVHQGFREDDEYTYLSHVTAALRDTTGHEAGVSP